MQHIKALGCGVYIQPPVHPHIRVEIVKPDRQARSICIAGIVLYLKVTDRTGGVVKNGGFGAVFHPRKLVQRIMKSIVRHQRPRGSFACTKRGTSCHLAQDAPANSLPRFNGVYRAAIGGADISDANICRQFNMQLITAAEFNLRSHHIKANHMAPMLAIFG